ncbi:MAG: DUF4301 family protein [Candidatus Cyclonatronum sp.]|uniref:DUF4301 family protein n=1 Tax=Cyclonatronum sp. TaxID=3024185 RepID=UPI0025C2A509|nr:DUF4301 family protein [Cyclonatronum sp.]MCH8487837.1 DUF4301 family protein [Cyclonatronum sp.]
MSSPFSTEVQLQIKQRGLTTEEAERQLSLFRAGIPPLRLHRAATIGDGILKLSEAEQQALALSFEQALEDADLKIMKFVPASGAASRMFKNLEYMVNTYPEVTPEVLAADDANCRFAKTFIDNLSRFAFKDALFQSMKDEGLEPEALLAAGSFRPFIAFTLGKPGLGYSNIPKALIQFHRNSETGEVRTSLEEHFSEGAQYAAGSDCKVNLHFTVSPEFEQALLTEAEAIKKRFGKSGFSFEVSLSNQMPSTDTLAVDEDNAPFTDENGNILFRPGGHGALLENLNRLDADIVFIKNIDNVVPDTLKPDTILWKKVLGGLLIGLRTKVFEAVAALESDAHVQAHDSAASLCTDTLNLSLPDDFAGLGAEDKRDTLLSLLNRPVRVCGMVKNEGEPGGGPFWIDKKSAVNKLQIVESSQMDTSDSQQMEIVQQATHFNPVDLVCSLTDANGSSFNLDSFTDPETAFIASKSYDGRALKALERPGLWNGAMAEWITLFVEVPVSTFNPVKTVNDLLRPTHQD